MKPLLEKVRRLRVLCLEHLLLVPCRFGLHKFYGKPVLTSLDTYWIQGGEECSRCRARRISFEEAAATTHRAYEYGKLRAESHFLAYGQGISKLSALYGKARVQEMLDKEVQRP